MVTVLSENVERAGRHVGHGARDAIRDRGRRRPRSASAASTVTSLGAHGPSGWASGGVVGLGLPGPSSASRWLVLLGAAPSARRASVLRLAGDLPGGVAARGRAVAAAAEHPADHEDEQEGEAEHEQPPRPVDARRQRAARTGRRHSCAHGNQRSARDRGSDTVAGRTSWPDYASASTMSDLHAPLLEWYDAHARDLPWRGPEASAVGGDGLGVHAPADAGRPGAAGARGLAGALADARRPGRRAEPARRCGPGAGSATRAGRCGCTPRRPRSSSDHGGEVPAAYDDLLRAAGRRRLHRGGDRVVRVRPAPRRARHQRPPGASPGRSTGVEFPAAAVTARRAATSPPALLPDDEPTAATWAVAVMELGALVCTATNPRCAALPDRRPVRLARGRPPGVRRAGRARCRRTPAPTGSAAAGCWAWSATATAPCPQHRMDATWADPVQRERALDSLLADGLLVRIEVDDPAEPHYALPDPIPRVPGTRCGRLTTGKRR